MWTCQMEMVEILNRTVIKDLSFKTYCIYVAAIEKKTLSPFKTMIFPTNKFSRILRI